MQGYPHSLPYSHYQSNALLDCHQVSIPPLQMNTTQGNPFPQPNTLCHNPVPHWQHSHAPNNSVLRQRRSYTNRSHDNHPPQPYMSIDADPHQEPYRSHSDHAPPQPYMSIDADPHQQSYRSHSDRAPPQPYMSIDADPHQQPYRSHSDHAPPQPYMSIDADPHQQPYRSHSDHAPPQPYMSIDADPHQQPYRSHSDRAPLQHYMTLPCPGLQQMDPTPPKIPSVTAAQSNPLQKRSYASALQSDSPFQNSCTKGKQSPIATITYIISI